MPGPLGCPATGRAGCATGSLADGGYRIGLEARDTVTGQILGRADVTHGREQRAHTTSR